MTQTQRAVDLIPELRLPQARVLRALLPLYPKDPISEWPLLTRSILAERSGYSALSGSITRALLGIREGNRTSGDPHKGLIELDCVQVIDVNIDGTVETNYRITSKGIAALRKYIMDGGILPPVKDPAAHTNKRYMDSELGQGS